MSWSEKWASYRRQQYSTLPLGLFRIVYGLCLLLEIWQLLDKYELIFSSVPFQVSGEVPMRPALVLWAVVCIAIIFGAWTRTALAINFALTVVFFGSTEQFEYHIDYIYSIINLLLLFVPLESALSVDAKLDPAVRRPFASRAGFDAILLTALVSIYFESSIYKWAADTWVSGLGFWRPASTPGFTVIDIGPFLDLKWLMLGLGFMTLIFETVFIVLMFFQRLRWPLIAIGLGLHLGICFVFPIPIFGLAVAALYLLFVPDPFWRRLAQRWTDGQLSEENERAAERAMAERPQRLRFYAITTVVVTFFLLQGIYMLRSPLADWVTRTAGIGDTSQNSLQAAQDSSLGQTFKIFSRGYFGAATRGLFVDQHFDGIDRAKTLVEVDEDGEWIWLPMMDSASRFRRGWTGRLWVWWYFRVSSPKVDFEDFNDRILRATAWWIGEHPRDTPRRRFLVIAKPYPSIDISDGWQKGRYDQLTAPPWQPVASVTWVDGVARIQHFPPGGGPDA